MLRAECLRLRTEGANEWNIGETVGTSILKGLPALGGFYLVSSPESTRSLFCVRPPAVLWEVTVSSARVRSGGVAISSGTCEVSPPRFRSSRVTKLSIWRFTGDIPDVFFRRGTCP